MEFEYWDCTSRMSKNGLYKLLYAIIMSNGAITSTCAIGCKNLSPKQNSYNEVEFRIKLPKGTKEKFELLYGYKLFAPPKITGV